MHARHPDDRNHQISGSHGYASSDTVQRTSAPKPYRQPHSPASPSLSLACTRHRTCPVFPIACHHQDANEACPTTRQKGSQICGEIHGPRLQHSKLLVQPLPAASSSCPKTNPLFDLLLLQLDSLIIDKDTFALIRLRHTPPPYGRRKLIQLLPVDTLQ